MADDDKAVVRNEFERAAEGFAERTKGRFDSLRVASFARVQPGESVLEVGAGTGHFLSLFYSCAGLLVALDLTLGMLAQGRSHHPFLAPVAGDGAGLPFKDACMDLVCSAQALHHMNDPVPVLTEMGRVARARVLVVDQIAPEGREQRHAMNELEMLRDPSHAASRPPSRYRELLRQAGLALVDERTARATESLSSWMWPGEFPAERIAAVRGFIEKRGSATGMDFVRDGDDWTFTRARIMLLCAAPS